MDCVIFRRGKAVGTLQLQQDGLYRKLYAELPPCRQLLRLYGPEKLGVFVPELSRMIFRRRISQTLLPVLPEWVCAWCEEDGAWTADSDRGFVRWLPTGAEYAISWQSEQPMPFPMPPQSLHPVLIGENTYLSGFKPYCINK